MSKLVGSGVGCGVGLWFAFCGLMSVASLGVTGYLIYLGIQVANKYLNG